MNPVLILTHNCLDFTKRCVESVKAQDIPTYIHLFDNGSTDGTKEWIQTEMLGYGWHNLSENNGVSVGWNIGIGELFRADYNYRKFTHVLVVNNDTILAPWTYRKLVELDLPFVTGISVDSMEQIATEPELGKPVGHPDFSCFLIRRDAWEQVGPFDERMKHYASDNDWHVRAHRAGVKLAKVNLPFYHERSSTLRLASPEERTEIEAQADRDREVFRSIYGCMPWEPGYEDLFR